MHGTGQSRSMHPRWLLGLPALAYAASYLYLAAYHGRANVWNVVVHESGVYTLWETTLYASHFLGHVPVHILAALLFVGAYRSVAPEADATPWRGRGRALGTAISVLLGGSLLLSLLHFGREDTVAFVLQRKQTPHLHVRGGSWNLHLASSTLLFAWAPLYVLAACRVCGRSAAAGAAGLRYFGAALLLLAGFTCLANGTGAPGALALAWTEPRYLAHSVRELATFSLTYFPIPLIFLLRTGAGAWPSGPPDRRRLAVAAVLAVVFAAALTYQCVASLSAGVGTLAQKPAFAHGGTLSVPYLLASHFFEHVLDTALFTLLVLWLWGRSGPARQGGLKPVA